MVPSQGSGMKFATTRAGSFPAAAKSSPVENVSPSPDNTTTRIELSEAIWRAAAVSPLSMSMVSPLSFSGRDNVTRATCPSTRRVTCDVMKQD
ncbi:Uncharacterised protein [Mycobacteroides abscessus subsp. abscessus]|nr:Uncharacterised protein [Mycobacteroides abscessus subsp. abscessus]